MQLWVPGAAGPSIDDFVVRLHKAIELFAERRGLPSPSVEIELADGATFTLHQIRAEPGYGFITLCPHPQEEGAQWDGECTPEEVIIPVGSIRRITLGPVEPPRARFGFSVPSGPEASA
jgi:hypothetical protein